MRQGKYIEHAELANYIEVAGDPLNVSEMVFSSSLDASGKLFTTAGFFGEMLCDLQLQAHKTIIRCWYRKGVSTHGLASEAPDIVIESTASADRIWKLWIDDAVLTWNAELKNALVINRLKSTNAQADDRLWALSR